MGFVCHRPRRVVLREGGGKGMFVLLAYAAGPSQFEDFGKDEFSLECL